jgi:hypothetical protein
VLAREGERAVSERGVFAIDRGIWDHPMFASSDPFSKREAWMWLISEAAWKPHRRRIAGVLADLLRGQLVHSLRHLAECWGWSLKRVRGFLSALEEDEMIATATDTGITVITICKYNEYQRVSLPKGTGSDTVRDTPTPTPSHTARAHQGHNKEDKEYREYKEDSLSRVSEEASKEAKRSGLKSLGTQLPENWTPDDELCEQVKSAFGMTDDDLRSELLGFHAEHAAKGTFSQNWRASFITWCKRFREHRDKQAPPRLELTKSPPKRRGNDWPPDCLEQFWASYPPGRKTGKKAVGAKLDVIRRRGDVTFDRLMAGLRRYVDSRPDPQYTKAPEVWLNKGCWDDELVFKGAPDGKTQTAVDPSKLGFAGLAAHARRATAPVERPAPEDLEPLN